MTGRRDLAIVMPADVTVETTGKGCVELQAGDTTLLLSPDQARDLASTLNIAAVHAAREQGHVWAKTTKPRGAR